ncbi:hypothetical protein ES703_122985 [subsurface metagenome]
MINPNKRKEIKKFPTFNINIMKFVEFLKIKVKIPSEANNIIK